MSKDKLTTLNINGTKWEYDIPEFPDGEYLFDGLPCPTKQAMKVLGEDGIKEIDKKLKEFKKWKESLYGEDSKRVGFDMFQKFRNENEDTISITGIADHYGKENYVYPERACLHRAKEINYLIDYIGDEVEQTIK